MKSCRFLSALLFAATALGAPPIVRVLDMPTRVEVSAAVADEKQLSVSLLDEAGKAGPPIIGTYRREGAQVVFTPRFALTSGARYRASAAGDSVEFQIAVSAPHASAVIGVVYPRCETVPANLLKFYLHFSRPMREGREVFTRIHLLDGRGAEVGAPWRDTELWTEDGKRLTLWIHPGRVKQGVNLREELGPVLRPGERYTLVVDAALRDATGQPLGREFRHSFSTTAESHARLDLTSWALTAPRTGTREPLRAIAPVALDHALAVRCLHVRDVDGQASIGPDERTWNFTPAEPWRDSPHVLLVDPWLEDLAGNTFERVFDNDLAAPPEQRAVATTREFTPVR